MKKKAGDRRYPRNGRLSPVEIGVPASGRLPRADRWVHMPHSLRRHEVMGREKRFVVDQTEALAQKTMNVVSFVYRQFHVDTVLFPSQDRFCRLNLGADLAPMSLQCLQESAAEPLAPNLLNYNHNIHCSIYSVVWVGREAAEV